MTNKSFCIIYIKLFIGNDNLRCTDVIKGFYFRFPLLPFSEVFLQILEVINRKINDIFKVMLDLLNLLINFQQVVISLRRIESRYSNHWNLSKLMKILIRNFSYQLLFKRLERFIQIRI